MLNIAICDDEKVQRNILKDMLYKICNKNNMDVIIDEFCSGVDLLNVYKEIQKNIV